MNILGAIILAIMLFCAVGLAAAQIYIAFAVYGNQRAQRQKEEDYQAALIKEQERRQIEIRSLKPLSCLRAPEEEAMVALAESLQLSDEQIN